MKIREMKRGTCATVETNVLNDQSSFVHKTASVLSSPSFELREAIVVTQS